MSNVTKQNSYDLEERTQKFGEAAISFVKKIPKNDINNSIVKQLIRSATSVGANYCEADCAESKKDFIHKISICNKEAKESKHWFRMAARAESTLKEEAQVLWQESHELNLIFISIIRKSKENQLNSNLR